MTAAHDGATLGLVAGQGRTAEQLAELINPHHRATPEQISIIEAGLRPTLVVAGAGSGKTETLSMRMVYLLDNAERLWGEPISPDEILCLTFTRKAAAEIAERAERRIGTAFDSQVTGPDGRLRAVHDPARPAPTVATYNSYAAALALEHGLRVGIDPESTVLTNAALWLLAERTLEEWTAALETDSAASTIRSSLPALAAQMRDHLVTPQQLRDYLGNTLSRLENLPKKAGDGLPGMMTQTLASQLRPLRTLLSMTDLVEDFEARKHRGAFLDFSDQISAAVRLAGIESVTERERGRYRAVLLDEFQDTSPGQLSLFADLFGADHPVMAVGDPHQAIYGFRGASAAALDGFVHAFGGPDAVTQHSLTISFRNEGAVLDVANAAVDPLRTSTAVAVPPLMSVARAMGGDEPQRRAPGVMSHMALTLDDEAEAVVDFIQDRRAELGHGVPGHAPIEAAVLCRRRASFAPIVDALRARGIAYEVVGLGGLLDTAEVADLVALLEIAHDPSRGDAALRLLTSERVNIGPADLAALHDWALVLAGDRKVREGNPSIVDAMADLPDPQWRSVHDRALSGEARRRITGLQAAVDTIRRHTYLPLTELIAFSERVWGLDIEAAVASPDGRARRNVDAFLDAARGFAQGSERATLGAFLAWLDAARAEESGLDAPVKEPELGAVQILTIHAAKGLEWDVVAVPGVVDGQFPSVTPPSASSPDYRDGAWLVSDRLQLPWPLRMDKDSLPAWHWHEARDHKELQSTIDDFKRAAGTHALAEERRLFYVALTRAKSHVLLSGSWFSTGSKVKQPSPYVMELIDQGVLSADTWVDAPADDAQPPEREVVTGVWPRGATAAQQARRVLAELVDNASRTLPVRPDGQVWDRQGPFGVQVAAILAERSARAATVHDAALPSHLPTAALVAMKRDRDAFAVQLRRPVPTEPTLAAQRGNQLHAWIEAQYGHLPLLDEASFEPDEEYVDDLESLKQRFLESEWATRTPTHVEVDVDVPLGAVTVRSRIDAVFGPGRGLDRVTIVDWKSGSPPKGGAERAAREVQLAMYRVAWAAREGLALEDVDAAFFYLGTGQTVRPERLLSRQELEQLLSPSERT